MPAQCFVLLALAVGSASAFRFLRPPTLEARLQTYLSEQATPEQKELIAKRRETPWSWLTNQSTCMQSRSKYAARKATKLRCKKVIEFGGFETPLSRAWTEMHTTPSQLYVNIDPAATRMDVHEDAEGHRNVQFPFTFQAYMDPKFQKEFPELANPDCVVILGMCWESDADIPQFLTLFEHAHLVVVEAATAFASEHMTRMEKTVKTAWGNATRIEKKEFDCAAERPDLQYQERSMFLFDRDADINMPRSQNATVADAPVAASR